ncbi:hypothetical protein AB0M32_36145 [Streptomyces sp. NPDC051985]
MGAEKALGVLRAVRAGEEAAEYGWAVDAVLAPLHHHVQVLAGRAWS